MTHVYKQVANTLFIIWITIVKYKLRVYGLKSSAVHDLTEYDTEVILWKKTISNTVIIDFRPFYSTKNVFPSQFIYGTLEGAIIIADG